ncbi:hypothetical protein APHNP_0011 [Anaplasma phagocytophilum str. ApNP]|uniref:Uncharacterized protein n=1 Tax=Anaplasma phagocytophilum str. ApNP TaxID=1359153 RepID=A0A0F3NH55_ANAPH|nr:hypothetical protein APHNP_0011 [Anaplasma phagocytophilum str. ApNP]
MKLCLNLHLYYICSKYRTYSWNVVEKTLYPQILQEYSIQDAPFSDAIEENIVS